MNNLPERGWNMFAVIALFDKHTEDFIRRIWIELEEHSISSYAFEIENRRPHITLASYTNLDLEDFISQLDDFYENKPVIPISFSSVGTFLKTGIIYYSPTMTSQLYTLHRSHHQHFGLFLESDSLYSPEQWIPHCTLANRLSHNQLLAAFSYCSQQPKLDGKIEAISIIEVTDTGKINTVFTKKLS